MGVIGHSRCNGRGVSSACETHAARCDVACCTCISSCMPRSSCVAMLLQRVIFSNAPSPRHADAERDRGVEANRFSVFVIMITAMRGIFYNCTLLLSHYHCVYKMICAKHLCFIFAFYYYFISYNNPRCKTNEYLIYIYNFLLLNLIFAFGFLICLSFLHLYLYIICEKPRALSLSLSLP